MSRNVSVLSLIAVVVVLWVALAAAGLLFVDFGESDPEPVAFEDTVAVGLTLDEELRLEDPGDGTQDLPWEDERGLTVDLPRMQVFYSEYPYVVGYWGVEQFVNSQDRAGHDQQFGHPMTTYVTVYDDQNVELNDESLPVAEDDLRWHAAEDAVYVVDSEARTPTGETVIPFEQRHNAESFVGSYGGEIISWEAVLDYPFAIDDAETVRERTADQLAAADELVNETSELLDRPVSVVVDDTTSGDAASDRVPDDWTVDPAGIETAKTVEAGIELAEPETTVLVADGTYTENVTVTTTVTLAGVGDARLNGTGDGTVLDVHADQTAITGLSIDGVGDDVPEGTGHDHDHGGGSADPDAEWDEEIEEEYASGDAGILVENASGVFVQDTTVETPSSGLLFRDSPGAVVQNVTVDGNPDYLSAHMGIVALRSPGVIEESTFRQGLDGVYTHHSNEIVIRNNTLVENRIGIHLMHTSDALLAGNRMVDSITEGIYVMTGPERNGIVDNYVENTQTGINVGGSESYIADNVLRGNTLGLQLDAVSTVVERNIILNNSFGVESWAMLPTNRVTENDFIGNDYHVSDSFGAERIWTHDGVGNYWEGAVGTTDGTTLDRTYSPTDGVDSELHRVDGTPALTQAPAMDALAGVEGAISGMRDGEITDRAPLCDPVHADWLHEHGWTEYRPSCPSTAEGS